MDNLEKKFYCDTIISESSIPDEFALVSKNGQFEAKLQTDGNFVIYKNPEKKVLWSTNTYGKGSAPYTLKIQNNGNIVLFDARKFMFWNSVTGGKGKPPYKLTMQNDGNLVLTDGNNLIFWATWTKLNY